MDSRLLEVVIGLVLVFAVTSLVVTTLHEIWTSARKSRGGALLLGVRSLFGDDDPAAGVWRIVNWRRSTPPMAFTEKVLQHPLLLAQVLGTAQNGRRPSYLPADVFVTALIAELCDRYTGGARPPSPREWVSSVSAGAAALRAGAAGDQPTEQLVRGLSSLLPGAAEDWPAYEKRLCAWYDAVMQRSIGWFKRDTQARLVLFGLGVAVILNINPLVIAKRLWHEPALRATTARMADVAAQAYAAAASVPAAGAASGAASGAAPSSDAALLRELVGKLPEALKAIESQAASASKPARARAASAASAADSSAPLRPESLEVDHALRGLQHFLLSATASTDSTADNAPAHLHAALERLIDLKEQVMLRRALAKAGGLVGLFDSSATIEDHLAGLREAWSKDRCGNARPTARSAGKECRSPFDKVELLQRLASALRAERDALLPPDAAGPASGQAGVGSDLAACLQTADEATRRLCGTLGALSSLEGMGLPIGWGWDNWPNCDAACQTRHRPQWIAPAQRRALDAYARSLEASRAALGASAPASAARELRQAFLDSRRELEAASLRAGARPAGVLAAESLGSDVWRGIWQALLGWFILAFGCSLGAPFWFDLLNRAVKLRASGTRVSSDGDDSGGGTAAPAGGKPAEGVLTRPDPGDAAAPASDDTGAQTAAERDLTTADIVRLQQALGLTGTEVSGRLDGDTRQAITAWQVRTAQGVQDGLLTAEQIGRLLATATLPAVAPGAAPPAAGSTHLRANGTINVLTEDEVRDRYGDITTVPDPSTPGHVTVKLHGQPGQAQHTLVPLAHALIPAARQLQVHAKALQHFKHALDDVQDHQNRHQVTLIHTVDGTFVPRHIGSNPNRPLSRHTWGIAIDLNQATNQQGTTGTADQIVLAEIMARHGFAWGGHFSTQVDPMHFELALLNP